MIFALHQTAIPNIDMKPLYKKNKFHFWTVLTLLLMMSLVGSFQEETTVWYLLFGILALNAVLSIFHRGIKMVSWIIITVCAFGIVMCLPVFADWILSGMPSFEEVDQHIVYKTRFFSFLNFSLCSVLGLGQVKSTN
ncbi:hypothetical protein [Membranihabitans marinus]|uniref:hypothetical protein n=1 Tax=Membranihabitans marinus TaxID=1227546 RepID=UPI001F40DA9D|nr:hypothetical protein [Membranihabitans marinus]